jgi:hypothetical protein
MPRRAFPPFILTQRLRVQQPKSAVPEQLLQEVEELKAVVHKLAETTLKPPLQSVLPVSAPSPAPDASPPQQAQLWTRGFLALFLAITTLGGLMIVLTSLHAEEGPAVFFLLTSAVVGLCGYGLQVARAHATSAGFLLQASTAAITTLVFLAVLLSGGDADLRDFFGLPLVVIASVLNCVSLIALAYGIAPWKPRALTGVLLVPVIVSSGLLIYSMAGGAVLSVALLICALSAPLVFLVRPQLWRQKPLLTLLVVLGEIGVLISYYAFYYRYGLIPYFGVGFRLEVGADQPLRAVFFVSYFLVLLAFVLVVQTERVQKRAQEAAKAA